MAIEKIQMPQLGESVTEGTISNWLVEPGNHVNKYDPIAEVMTDKVSAEVPSSYTGVIKELVAGVGETIAVGELMCYIEVENTTTDGKQEQPAKVEENNEVVLKRESSNKTGKSRYSPAVLRLAQDHDIDLKQVAGTGRDGRITRKDLQKLIESGNIPKGTSVQAEGQQETIQVEKPRLPKQTTVAPGDTEIPLSGVRKAIAANMRTSKHEIPHAWTMVEVDVTNLVNYRNSVKKDFKAREGFNLTFLPFFIKAVVEALKEYPQINSMWAGDKIIQKKDINISIAVAREDSLFVPVIKNADEKSIMGIGKDVVSLANKVRTGKISNEEMKGGTFTVNNTGSFGSIQSMPIINYPQAAILSVEAIVKRPVIMENNMIAIRDMVNLCMSIDHRILDGLICGGFLARVKQILENTSKENTPIY